MTDRALLFLVSLFLAIGCVAVAIWLIASRQIGAFDGNFMLLSSLLIAAVFVIYMKYLIRTTLEPPAAPKRVVQHAVQQEKKAAAPEPELVGKV